MEKSLSAVRQSIDYREAERALVEDSANGDASAFDQLVHAHSAQVFRLALGMLGNYEEAADVQQEAFINAYRQIGKFRGDASFGTWLYKIAARLCLARQRRIKHKQEELTEDVLQASGHVEISPEKAAAALDAARRVQTTLASMQASDRLLIVLKFVEQLSHKEIAEALGCSVESSRSRLNRAKKIFRQKYREME